MSELVHESFKRTHLDENVSNLLTEYDTANNAVHDCLMSPWYRIVPPISLGTYRTFFVFCDLHEPSSIVARSNHERTAWLPDQAKKGTQQTQCWGAHNSSSGCYFCGVYRWEFEVNYKITNPERRSKKYHGVPGYDLSTATASMQPARTMYCK